MIFLGVLFEVPGHLVLSLYDLCVYDVDADGISTPHRNYEEIKVRKDEKNGKWIETENNNGLGEAARNSEQKIYVLV